MGKGLDCVGEVSQLRLELLDGAQTQARERLLHVMHVEVKVRLWLLVKLLLL